MKNNIVKLIRYLYYLSLIVLFILYLFPGSIIGYIFYGNLTKQPNLIDNPFGTSINHFFYFFYLTILASFFITEKKKLISFSFILFISIFLEIFHFIIPNRSFELKDLIANISGVLLVFIFLRIFKWRKIY